MDMYAMWLTCRMGSATVKTSALLKHFGSPEAIYHARSEELAAVARLTKQETEQLSRHELDDVKRLMERCNTLGIDVIHPWEEGYPALLGRIKNPPFTLFYRGKLSVVQRTLCIAIVGTRSCTRYGASVAEKLAGDLAACGVTVVSGMADGIDSCANLGALKAAGKTVAVLGNGVDRAYPAHNGYLMDQIIESGGLVASEYPPGSAIARGNFPARNRIISGLSQGVVIVEAPKKSGALITAQLAIEQDRDLFTVPGNINSYASEGTNQLLKDNCAKPVTETLDVLEEYLGSYGHLLSVVREAPPAQTQQSVQKRSLLERVTGGRISQEKAPAAPSEQTPSPERVQQELSLSKEEQDVLALLKGEPKSADALIKESRLPVGKAMATLTMLEAKGYIKSLPGARFERNFRV